MSLTVMFVVMFAVGIAFILDAAFSQSVAASRRTDRPCYPSDDADE